MLNLVTKVYIGATETALAFKKDCRGVTAVEYGLIAVVMATFVIFTFTHDAGFLKILIGRFKELTQK